MNQPAPVQLSLMPVISVMPVPPVPPMRPYPAVSGVAPSARDDASSASPGAPSGAPAQAEREATTAELQRLLTELFLQDDPAQRLMAVAGVVPEAHRSAWHLVTHTLLARRLALGSPAHLRHAADAHTLAWGLARQWDQPVLLQRWERLINRMTTRQCQQLTARLRRQMLKAALH